MPKRASPSAAAAPAAAAAPEVGTTVAAVTGATAAGSLAYAQKGVTGTLILIYPSSLSVTIESDIHKDSYIYMYI